MLEYLLQNWKLLRFSPPVRAEKAAPLRISPKRMRREIAKQMEQQGVGTKSQQALKLQHEEGKIIRKQKSREQREAEKLLQYELRQQKKPDKHKGH